MLANNAHPHSPHHLARGKYFALACLLGLGIAGFWHSIQSDLSIDIDEGQDNQDHRVLIWASGDKGIEDWLNKQIMTTGHYPYRKDPSPVLFSGERAPADLKARADQRPVPEQLDEVLSWADLRGFAYVAFDLGGPGSESTKAMIKLAAPAVDFPEGVRWAVISSRCRLNTLKISFGAVQPGIVFSAIAGPRASLMQALLGDSRLARFRRPTSRGGSIGEQDLAQHGLDFSALDWQAFSYPSLTMATVRAWPNHLFDSEANPEQPQWFAPPMQRARAHVLSESTLVVATTPLIWYSQWGQKAVLKSDADRQGWKLSLLGRDGDSLRKVPCDGFPDKPVLAMRAGHLGDALQIRDRENALEIYALTFDEEGNCRAELRNRLERDESGGTAVLGVPNAEGRSSWLVADQNLHTLAWRDPRGRGRIHLPTRRFVRGRWRWKSGDELLALTHAPSEEGAKTPPFQLERIKLNPQAEHGIERTVISGYSDLDSASDALPAPAAWPELLQMEREHFGARGSQAVFRSTRS